MMNKILSIPYWAFIALLIYMPFHIFISQWLSTYTGGLEVWKAAKDVLLFTAVLSSFVLVYLRNGFKDKLFWRLSALSLLYVCFHFFIWALNADIEKNPAILGTVYNSRLFGYLILGFAAAILFKDKLNVKQVFRLAIIISTVVCPFALLQWFFPKDIFEHFCYSVERGVKPNFFIDDKPDLPRIFSTLRDPTSLGAYLMLPITLLTAAWFKMPKARTLIGGLLLLHGLILLLTFSRGAWIGTILSVGLILLVSYKNQAKKLVERFWPFLVAGVVSLLLVGFLLRDQYFVQNVVFHADESTQQADPNEKRINFYKDSVEDITEHPYGYGPGTAGLVSIQAEKTVLTENYFLQIAYEVGIIGLILLLYMMFVIIKRLYERGDIYAQIVLCAFVGITFSNMLLHTWSNEAVAAQWWLLAGFLLVLPAKKRSKSS